MPYGYDGQQPYPYPYPYQQAPFNPEPNLYQQQPPFYQESSQYAAPQYQQFQSQQQPAPSGQAGPGIQVIIPSRQPEPLYQPPPPQPGYHYNQQFISQPPNQNLTTTQQHPVNGYASMPSRQPSSVPAPKEQAQQNGHTPAPPPAASRVDPQRNTPTVPKVDYLSVLLSVADEYLAAAAELNDQSETYFELISAALGCIESVLINFKLSPLREAQLSLRYAQILYEETENYDNAERVLTKAIDICERNKYVDLKYNLQLLLASVLYLSKPKAAMKDLQTMLEELKAYKHVAWEYAARYQLAMLYLSAPAVRDLHTAIQHIEKLASLANNAGDTAVAAFASIVCSLLHLQTSSVDAVSSSQQALAKARALSASADVSSVPQFTLMMEFVDLCASIRETSPEQADKKRKRMQEVWAGIENAGGWAQDGAMLYLPVGKGSLRGIQLQPGGVIREVGGKHVLPFMWMDENDAEALAFLLCAVSSVQKNQIDGGKAEQFIQAGLQRSRNTADRTITSQLQKLLESQFLLQLAFIKCQQGNWDKAQEAIDTATQVSKKLEQELPGSLSYILQYLRGVVQQGSGKLDAALQIYQLPMFSLGQFTRGSEPTQSHRSRDTERETMCNISILAVINRTLIINDPSHPQYKQLPAIYEQINSLIETCRDGHIKVAHSLIHSNIMHSTVVVSKNTLVQALNQAKAIANSQVRALILITIFQKFFLRTTDPQATNCLKATSSQIKAWGNTTWLHVMAGVESDALEFWGRSADANVKMQQAREILGRLPEDVRAKVQM